MHDPAPFFYMLVGLPGSGKTYWRNRFIEHNPHFVAVSSDDYIEETAKQGGSTYSEVFTKAIGDATKYVNDQFAASVERGNSMVWDQTNLTKHKRYQLLSQLPGSYIKVAIYFEVDEHIRQKRLLDRPGKVIPYDVDLKMQQSYSRPTVDEGFHCVMSSGECNWEDK